MGIVLRADPNASDRMKEITGKLANGEWKGERVMGIGRIGVARSR